MPAIVNFLEVLRALSSKDQLSFSIDMQAQILLCTTALDVSNKTAPPQEGLKAIATIKKTGLTSHSKLVASIAAMPATAAMPRS